MEGPTSQNPYVYPQLRESEFRLITLYPSSYTGGKIKIGLDTHRLPTSASTIFYEAISYSWNNETPSRTIDCEGDALIVTPNLYEALEQFRHRDEFRTLWADAICINQQDTREKNHQVSQMRVIFQQAQQTLAWLGRSHDDAWVLETLSTQYTQSNKLTQQRWSHETDEGQQEEFSWGGGHSRHDFAMGILRLTQSPYFTRAWIWQEITVPNAVLCRGRAQLEWYEFYSVLSKLRRDDEMCSVHPDLRAAIDIVLRLSAARSDDVFFNIICNSSSANCSNPRDHVYAFLGLCDATTRSSMSVDYYMPISHVYSRATIDALRCYENRSHWYNNGAHLFFMCCGLTDFHRQYNLPAWVPNYGRLRHVSLWQDAWREDFRASRYHRGALSVSPWGAEMVLKGHGVFVDEVADIGVSIDPDSISTNDSKSLLQVIRILLELDEWRQIERKPTVAPSADCDHTVNLWPTGWSLFFFTNSSSVMLKNDFVGTMRRLRELAASEDPLTQETVDGSVQKALDMRMFLRACREWLGGGGKAGSTQSARRAFLPFEAQVGDLICLMAGSNAPLVVRASDSGFKLIGWCFLEGAMNGSLWPRDWEGVALNVADEIDLI